MTTPAPKRPRPYRAFLTPALHHRFTRAGGLAFALCYAESIWIGEFSPLWSWFPIGPAGARAAILAMSVLLVMIIRVARLHVGTRTTASPFATFQSQLTSVSTYITFVWYIVSALLFAEVYLWSRPASAGFSIIDQGRYEDASHTSRAGGLTMNRSHERARLNERSVAFRALFIMLGVAQSFIHLFSDWDKVPTATRKLRLDPKSAASIVGVDSPLAQLKSAGPAILMRLIWVTIVFPVLGFIVYLITPLRSIAWRISFDTLRFIWFLPIKARTNRTGFAPFFTFYLAVVVQTALLVLLWEFTNAAFSAWISQEPLNKSKPLTEDDKNPKGRDPNGSLINGLKSKKDFARASAFYELLLITVSFPDRRKTIFTELDRAGGNTWSQISALCLEQVQGIKARINDFNAGANPAPPPPPEIKVRQPITAPLKQDNIFVGQPGAIGRQAKMAEWAKTSTSSTLRQFGSRPGAKPVTDAVEWTGQKLLTDGQRANLQPQQIGKKSEGVMETILQSPVGWPFRQSFERRVTGVICGTPYSMAGVVCDATDALTCLVAESLKEDVYGQVRNDVVVVLREYIDTLKAIDAFIAGCAPHWTDVSSSRTVGEVEDVREALREGLGAVLGAFGEYLAGMGMSASEIKEIKAVVGEGKTNRKTKGREMEKAS